MQLYYKPGACSLAAHIALIEAGMPFDLVAVDTDTQRTGLGEDYRAINRKGYVPTLRLADGRTLSEGAAVLQFIADRHPEAGLAPHAGSFARAELQEHLNYIASEVHKAFKPFFAGPTVEGEAREAAAAHVLDRLGHMEAVLADGRPYLDGETFSVADAYLFVVAGWAGHVGISLADLPRLERFLARVAERQSTRAAQRAEGLLT